MNSNEYSNGETNPELKIITNVVLETNDTNNMFNEVEISRSGNTDHYVANAGVRSHQYYDKEIARQNAAHDAMSHGSKFDPSKIKFGAKVRSKEEIDEYKKNSPFVLDETGIPRVRKHIWKYDWKNYRDFMDEETWKHLLEMRDGISTVHINTDIVPPSEKAINVGWDIVKEMAKQSLLSSNTIFTPDGSDPYIWIYWIFPGQGIFIIVTDIGEILVETTDSKIHTSTKMSSIKETVEHVKNLLSSV